MNITAYINTMTMDYPRHTGDILLDFPEWDPATPIPLPYATVKAINHPETEPMVSYIYELPPELVSGEWQQRIEKRYFTPEQIAKFVISENEFMEQMEKLRLGLAYRDLTSEGNIPDVIG